MRRLSHKVHKGHKGREDYDDRKEPEDIYTTRREGVNRRPASLTLFVFFVIFVAENNRGDLATKYTKVTKGERATMNAKDQKNTRQDGKASTDDLYPHPLCVLCDLCGLKHNGDRDGERRLSAGARLQDLHRRRSRLFR